MNAKHGLRVRDFLDHLIEAMDRIEVYTAGKSEETFFSDKLLQDAVVRNVEILGETSKNILALLPDAPERFSGIPFANIYRTRNRLSHAYFILDVTFLWEVVKRDVPALRAAVEAAIVSWDAANPTE